MFAPGVPQVLSDFKSDNALLGSFVVSVYILGYATGPLVIAPLSECYGRKWVYHTTNVLFVITTIACAVASNLNMLIGFRFLAGCAGSAVLTMGGGTVADLFIQEERGTAIALWSLYVYSRISSPYIRRRSSIAVLYRIRCLGHVSKARCIPKTGRLTQIYFTGNANARFSY